MLRQSWRPIQGVLLSGILLGTLAGAPPAGADDDPIAEADSPAAYIYRQGDYTIYYRQKIFLEAGPQLIAPLILNQYGEALSILIAPVAQVTLNGITIENGREYLLGADGSMLRNMDFPQMTLDTSLGEAAPGKFVEGRALVELDGVFPVCTIEENRYGVRTLTLAKNKWQDPRSGSLHMYNGIRLSFDEDSSIESSLAFAEYALNGTLTQPLDPEANPWGQPQGGIANPYGPNLPPGVFLDARGIYVDAAGNPIGRPVDEPRETLQAPKKYLRPAIKIVGIIPFRYEGKLGTQENPRSNASPELYINMVNDLFIAELSKIPDLEVKVLELAPEDVSGAYVLSFAKKIGQKYGCDAILTGTILSLDSSGGNRNEPQIKVSGRMAAELIDTTGGRFNWQNTGRLQRFATRSNYESNSSAVIRDLLGSIASSMVGEMRSKTVFDEREI